MQPQLVSLLFLFKDCDVEANTEDLNNYNCFIPTLLPLREVV